jgi:hypothetical protein
MDLAKFCTATQAMVTLKYAGLFALLRSCLQNKQEEDHVRALHAMPLRRASPAKIQPS